MHLFKKISLIAFVLLLAFATYTLVSTGFFRTVENQFDGRIVKEIALPGAEDIWVSLQDSFALISSTDRGVFPPQAEEKGGLYWMELKSGQFNIQHLSASFPKAFAPHGISTFRKDSSYQVMAISHTLQGHSIEVFELQGDQLTRIKTLRDSSMISPNDLVMIDEHRFYFTNDHKYTKGLGRLLEDYGGLSVSNVVYFDGETYREVADGIAYANGINYDVKRALLFVASPRAFQVQVYSKKPDGSLAFIENIPCGTGVDNIEFDADGHLWIGAHPNLMRFSAYAKGKKDHAPSEIIEIDYRGKNDYTVEQIYVEDGQKMSASSVAAPFGQLILTGNVMDDAFLILERAH